MINFLYILTVASWILSFFYIYKYKLKITNKLFFYGLLLYVIPAIYLPTITDVGLFETVGIKTLERVDFYWFDGTNHGTYPFLPFMLWFYAFAHKISSLTSLNFIFLVRLLVIGAVVLNVFIIRKILGSNSKSKRVQAIFLFSPISFFVASFHAQVDYVLASLVLLSVWLLIKKQQSIILSGVSFGLSILTKTWSIIFFPLFLINIQKTKNIGLWILGSVTILMIFVLSYIQLFRSSFSLLFETLSSHAGGVPGTWGLTGFLALFKSYAKAFSLIINFLEVNSFFVVGLGLVVAYIIILYKKIDLLTSFVLLLLMFLIVTPGWGFQYISWIVPFAAVAGFNKRLKLFSLIATPYIILAYSLIAFEEYFTDQKNIFSNMSIILSLAAWLYVINWFFEIIRSNVLKKE